MEFNWQATVEGLTVTAIVSGRPPESTLLRWDQFGEVMANAFADMRAELGL